ncbi:hypothetical protein BH20ACT6_BH20ACT6_17710 [soil metagenome]
MSLPMFWRESLDADGAGVLVLDGAEGQHAAVVRRLGVGERVRVTDGRGSYVDGPVAAVGKRSVSVSVGDRVSAATGDVVLVVGPEGGISAAELAALGLVPDAAPSTPAAPPTQASPRAARLGDTVLRTSTAGSVASGVVLAATRWR